MPHSAHRTPGGWKMPHDGSSDKCWSGAVVLSQVCGLMPLLGRADLHVHSHWSDGMQSPERIIKAASGRVDVLAITDHDEIQGAIDGRDYALRHPRSEERRVGRD